MVGMNDYVATVCERRGGRWTEAQNNVVEDAARAPGGRPPAGPTGGALAISVVSCKVE